MSAKLRCVFDTNTLVSALLFQDRSPGRALLHAFSIGDVLTNMDVIGELAEVLRREKFDRYVKRKLREDFLRTLIQKSVFVKNRIDPIKICRDPKDDKFLELAVSGNASHLISGDHDLLILHPFQNISILTPTQFLNRFPPEPTSVG